MNLIKFCEDIYNEAHGHHGHHHTHKDRNDNMPQFNKKGDWYHDGICTHYDGLKMEDLWCEPNGRKLSCGFLVEDEITGLYLGCRPTGSRSGRYDIPKGCRGLDGTDLENAIRELKEETGIELTGNENIEDLGKFDHLDDKDLHLFKVTIPVDIKTLHCDSMFKDFRDGALKPEVDDFKLLDDVSMFLRSLQDMLNQTI